MRRNVRVALAGRMIIDPRFSELARGLTGFSTALKKGERVLIDAFDVPDAMVIALIRATRARGAFPYVQIHRARVTRELSLGAEEAQFAPHADVELVRMQKMDAYIALRGSGNIFEVSDVPSDRVQLVSRLMKPVLDYRVGRTKWVVLRWPLASRLSAPCASRCNSNPSLGCRLMTSRLAAPAGVLKIACGVGLKLTTMRASRVARRLPVRM